MVMGPNLCVHTIVWFICRYLDIPLTNVIINNFIQAKWRTGVYF